MRKVDETKVCSIADAHLLSEGAPGADGARGGRHFLGDDESW